MRKIIVVTAAVAFLVGMIFGLNSGNGGAQSSEQLIGNAISASSVISEGDTFGTPRWENIEELGSELDAFGLLEQSYIQRVAERDALISEINRLQSARAIFAKELDETVFAPGRSSAE